MKYKLIGENNYKNDNIIKQIFKNRGIEDYKRLLNVNENDENDYNLLDNIDEAIECIIEHLDNEDDILVVVDPDCDGNTSASMLINYLNLVYKNPHISWIIHNGKQHGLSDIQVYGNIKLVIVPDAGSNDYEFHKQLKERGIDCLIIDHHLCEKYSEDAIVVNNQLSKKYPNKQLSGVGVTYKFLQALDDVLWKEYSSNFIDLVALGNIGDSMNTTNYETRYYIKQGLNCITNPFILSLINKQNFSMNGTINITNFMFYIVPLINALIRVGSYADKETMFKCFLGKNNNITYKSRGKDKTDTLCNFSARNCVNAKAKQKRETDKFLDIINQMIIENEYDKNNIIILDVTNKIKVGGLTGLIATKIAEKYHKPVIIISKGTNKLLNGSARGYGNEFNFKDIVNNTKLVELAEGHQFAFGISLKEENLEKFRNKINKSLENIISDKIYDVDFILSSSDITYDLINNIYQLKDEYGKGLDEPLLCIENIEILTENIQLIGSKKNTIKIKDNNINYMKFFSNEDEYNKLINNSEDNTIKLNIIGKASINKYNGNSYPQIIIKDYEIIK